MRVAGQKASIENVVADDQFGLLRNLAEDLKVPLSHIIYQADDKEYVQKIAMSATNLIDAYILSVKVASGQQSLNIEPVSLRPVFDEVAHSLYSFAKRRGFDFQNSIPRKSLVVLSDRKVLSSLLGSLGYSCITNNLINDDRVVRFLAKNTKDQIKAGILSNSDLKASDLNMIKKLSGRASVLSSSFSFGTSSGVVIADVFARLLGSSLAVTKQNNHSGFEISLIPSRQLSFI